MLLCFSYGKNYRISKILTEYLSPGASTSTTSPAFLPIKAFPKSDSILIIIFSGSRSKVVTRVIISSSSSSINFTFLNLVYI